MYSKIFLQTVLITFFFPQKISKKWKQNRKKKKKYSFKEVFIYTVQKKKWKIKTLDEYS